MPAKYYVNQTSCAELHRAYDERTQNGLYKHGKGASAYDVHEREARTAAQEHSPVRPAAPYDFEQTVKPCADDVNEKKFQNHHSDGIFPAK